LRKKREREGAQEPRPVPPEGLGGEAGTLSAKALNPDTSVATATVDAWNGIDWVTLRVVSSTEICGARMADGEVDFLAGAGSLERPGALT